MGAILSRAKAFCKFLRRKKECRILMVGLDSAGKTTILYSLKLGEVTSTVPTIGFNVQNLEYKSLNMNVWDVGGQDLIRPLWKHYYANVGGIIYVVDCADLERIDLARSELQGLLNESLLLRVPLLVYANKQDLPRALSAARLTESLGLTAVHDRKWYVQESSAINGNGLPEGLDWLAEQISP